MWNAKALHQRLAVVEWVMMLHHQGKSFRRIAQMLNDGPWPPPTGGKWSVATVWRIVQENQRTDNP